MEDVNRWKVNLKVDGGSSRRKSVEDSGSLSKLVGAYWKWMEVVEAYID